VGCRPLDSWELPNEGVGRMPKVSVSVYGPLGLRHARAQDGAELSVGNSDVGVRSLTCL
jgi:hypothetical protein